jgi:hypothetical protein
VRRDLVWVSVVEIRVVRVRVHHRLVPVPVRVGLTELVSSLVLVLVVLVVHVRVLVL